MNSEIFLSYTRADLNDALQLKSALNDYGFSVWHDLDCITSGDDFSKTISCAVNKCKVFLALLSNNTEHSMWFNKELDYALSLNKEIIYVWGSNSVNTPYNYQKRYYHAIYLSSDKCIRHILSILIRQKVTCDTSTLMEKANRAWSDGRNDTKAFHLTLGALELGSKEAADDIERGKWDLNLRNAVCSYKEYVQGFVISFAEDLYSRGEMLAEDPTISDVAIRGRGMERAAFKMMRRAIDLGYNGNNPKNHSWFYLEDEDFEECYKELGMSSRFSYQNNSKESKPHNNGENTIKETISMKIFISHKNDDKPIVLPIVEHIEKETGQKCWIDLEGIESDAQFVDVICKAINECEIFLFMYTSRVAETSDFQSDWMSREINYAEKRKKRIVIINVDGSVLNDHYDLLYGTKHHVDIRNEVRLKKLLDDLKKWSKSGSEQKKKVETTKFEEPQQGCDVFISYSRKDSHIAVVLYNQLTELGLNVWFYQNNLLNFQDCGREIINTIRSAKYFVPILTDNIKMEKHEPKMYRKEWHHAIDKQLMMGSSFILPIATESFDFYDYDSYVPEEIIKRNALLFNSDEDLKQVAEKIKAIVDANKA